MWQAYLDKCTAFDWIIWSLGGILLITQFVFVVALFGRWKFATQNGDFWRNLFASCCEFFPLLGLLGTVLGILNTFGNMPSNMDSSAMQEILGNFAPALTTTVSGILCLIPNLFLNVLYTILL